MISSILNLSRLQSRGAPVEKSVVTASELFTQRIEDYAAMCDGMDIEFEASPELMSLPEMYTSKRLIWQLMDILVDNAVKFVGDSGMVSMGARHSEDRATIWVRDNGIGIEKEELEKIFLRFYRINRSDRIAGNGLGLAIAREICCALGEKLWVESRPGEGSVFYFTVRLRG